ncbi:DUF6691 family protein [Rubrobacter indicoceani]|uniref:DUF6691 family protein n=1 Tax=Rubrobacter indicoceani TaxID=2051957 RepID=UPI000E5B0ED8|nr:DUF6691 family protein [Rubrobacter indicoceani]
MSRVIVALLTGGLFGLGLAVSGMMNPARVLGFLDFAGDWDPTLAFVMGGALLVTVTTFRFILKSPRPLLEEKFYLPEKGDLDAKLLGGAVLFGVGWGLVGLCPGPALVAVVAEVWPIVAFVAAMLVGMLLHAVTFGRSGKT